MILISIYLIVYGCHKFIEIAIDELAAGSFAGFKRIVLVGTHWLVGGMNLYVSVKQFPNDFNEIKFIKVILISFKIFDSLTRVAMYLLVGICFT